MIDSRKKLKFYLKADFIMNHGDYSLKNRLKVFFSRDLISKQLKLLRQIEFCLSKNYFCAVKKLRYKMICYKTGVQIPPNVFEYGLVIPHHGTIVVGQGNKIGPYCVLHTCTCITEGSKNIGKGFYLSAGAKVYKDVNAADFISVGMNSIVNTNLNEKESFYAGIPAIRVKHSEPWFIRDGLIYTNRVQSIESIKV